MSYCSDRVFLSFWKLQRGWLCQKPGLYPFYQSDFPDIYDCQWNTMPLFIMIKDTFVPPIQLWFFCSLRRCLRVAPHIPRSDIESNHCFVFNSGCEESKEDTPRTGAGLERDGSPSQAPACRISWTGWTKHSLLHWSGLLILLHSLRGLK